MKNLIEQLLLEHLNRGTSFESMPDITTEYNIMVRRGYGMNPDKVAEIIKFLYTRYINNHKNFNKLCEIRKNIKYIFTENTFTYDKYTRVINPERLKLLRGFGDDNCAMRLYCLHHNIGLYHLMYINP